MADNRDVLAQMLAAGQTGGLTPGDFTTFANKLNDPTALQAWNAAGGIYGQNGGQVPDPDEQYFGNRGPLSGSTPETSWMHSVQPWQQGGQGGGETSYMSQQMAMPGWIGAGGAMHADPAYWGYQGRGQGYAPGSMGDLSGFNAGRGGGAGGTGGLTPQDAATFSRLVGPKAFQDWLNAGGVQGQFGGGMGGAVGGGGGSVGGGGGHGPSSSGGPNVGNANVGNTVGRGGMSMGDALSATVNATPEGWGTFGNMQGPMGPASGNIGQGFSALGNMGAPAGFGSETGFTNTEGVSGSANQGGFY